MRQRIHAEARWNAIEFSPLRAQFAAGGAGGGAAAGREKRDESDSRRVCNFTRSACADIDRASAGRPGETGA